MNTNQKDHLNTKEEKDYSTRQSNHINHSRKRTLYVVNLTPTRMLVCLSSFVLLVLFTFVAGLKIGALKDASALSNTNSTEILIGNEEDFKNDFTNSLDENNMASPSASSYADFENVEPYTTITSKGRDSIIREGNTTEDRYNEYTQSLALELDNINENIRERNTSNLPPNTTYTPPQQYSRYSEPTTTTTVRETVTKKPYTRDSSLNSVYFIQVAVGYDKESTYAARDNLKRKFPKAFIREEKNSDGKTMYKLKVGRYDSRESAQKALSEIKKIPAYKDSYIYSDKKSN